MVAPLYLIPAYLKRMGLVKETKNLTNTLGQVENTVQATQGLLKNKRKLLKPGLAIGATGLAGGVVASKVPLPSKTPGIAATDTLENIDQLSMYPSQLHKVPNFSVGEVNDPSNFFLGIAAGIENTIASMVIGAKNNKLKKRLAEASVQAQEATKQLNTSRNRDKVKLGAIGLGTVGLGVGVGSTLKPKKLTPEESSTLNTIASPSDGQLFKKMSPEEHTQAKEILSPNRAIPQSGNYNQTIHTLGNFFVDVDDVDGIYNAIKQDTPGIDEALTGLLKKKQQAGSWLNQIPWDKASPEVDSTVKQDILEMDAINNLAANYPEDHEIGYASELGKIPNSNDLGFMGKLVKGRQGTVKIPLSPSEHHNKYPGYERGLNSEPFTTSPEELEVTNRLQGHTHPNKLIIPGDDYKSAFDYENPPSLGDYTSSAITQGISPTDKSTNLIYTKLDNVPTTYKYKLPIDNVNTSDISNKRYIDNDSKGKYKLKLLDGTKYEDVNYNQNIPSPDDFILKKQKLLTIATDPIERSKLQNDIESRKLQNIWKNNKNTLGESNSIKISNPTPDSYDMKLPLGAKLNYDNEPNPLIQLENNPSPAISQTISEPEKLSNKKLHPLADLEAASLGSGVGYAGTNLLDKIKAKRLQKIKPSSATQ